MSICAVLFQIIVLTSKNEQVMAEVIPDYSL